MELQMLPMTDGTMTFWVYEIVGWFEQIDFWEKDLVKQLPSETVFLWVTMQRVTFDQDIENIKKWGELEDYWQIRDGQNLMDC